MKERICSKCLRKLKPLYVGGYYCPSCNKNTVNKIIKGVK